MFFVDFRAPARRQIFFSMRLMCINDSGWKSSRKPDAPGPGWGDIVHAIDEGIDEDGNDCYVLAEWSEEIYVKYAFIQLPDETPEDLEEEAQLAKKVYAFLYDPTPENHPFNF